MTVEGRHIKQLKYSQQSALEKNDMRVAMSVQSGVTMETNEVSNDGTSACAFLGLKICYEFEINSREIVSL